jgi:hypothetical protein
MAVNSLMGQCGPSGEDLCAVLSRHLPDVID